MDNKNMAERQFCSQQNIEYLYHTIKWDKDINILKETVYTFMNNNKQNIDNFHDHWRSVRHLNKLFIINVDKNPSTETLYSTPAETILHNEEIYI